MTGFKFDDSDDELSLDLGNDAPKTQNPAPLPKTVKPTGDSLSKLPKPGQNAPATPEKPATLPKKANSNVTPKAPAPKIPSQPAQPVENVPTASVKKVAKPVVKPEPVEELIVDDMYGEEEIPSYYEEPIPAEIPSPSVPKPVAEPPQLNRGTQRRTRRRETYVQDGSFQPESENILSTAEANSTFKKQSPFDGERKRVMRIRVVASTVAVLLMAAGIYSFIPKPGFKDDVSQINAAITYANKYDAIKTSSENYALRFTTDFLNRTEVSESTHRTTMQTYMDAKTLALVDFSLTSIPTAGQPNGISVYMKPIGGPYIYSINNIDAAKIQSQRINEGNGYVYSIVTATYVQPYISPNDAKYFGEGGAPVDLQPKWVYLSVPVMHDYATKQTTLYGFPSFYTPEKTAGLDKFYAPYEEAEWPQKDEKLSGDKVLTAQLESFLAEWSKQSPNQKVSPALQALLADTATDRTKTGLAGAYTNAEGQKIIYAVNVKPMPEGKEAKADTVRTALVTVKWIDAQQNKIDKYVPATYTQQYLIDFKGSGDKWQILDIRARFAE